MIKKRYLLNIMNVYVYPCFSYTACRSHLFCTALYCYLSPVLLYHIFLYYLTNGIIFWRNALNIKCMSILYNFCPKPFSFWEEFIERLSWMYIGLHVNYPLFLSDLMKFEFSWQIFEKSSCIKFHENPYIGSQIVWCRQTETWIKHVF